MTFWLMRDSGIIPRATAWDDQWDMRRIARFLIAHQIRPAAQWQGYS